MVVGLSFIAIVPPPPSPDLFKKADGVDVQCSWNEASHLKDSTPGKHSKGEFATSFQVML